jgi:hypothetical protein
MPTQGSQIWWLATLLVVFGKQKRLDPVLHLHLDWKCNGNDVFGMMPELYPSLKCLRSAEYKTLADELGLESGEESMGALAAFLEPHNLELWNINDHGDNYRLAIVQAKHVDAFIEFWKSDASSADNDDNVEESNEHDDEHADDHDDEFAAEFAVEFAVDLEKIVAVAFRPLNVSPRSGLPVGKDALVGLEAQRRWGPPASKSLSKDASGLSQDKADGQADEDRIVEGGARDVKKRNKTGKTRIKLVEDQFLHSSYGGISFVARIDCYWVENRNTQEYELLDFSTWPPKPITVAGRRGNGSMDLHDWRVRPRPMGNVSGVALWQVDGTPKGQDRTVDRFVTIASFDPLDMQPWADESKRYSTIYGAAATAGDALFVHTSGGPESGKVHRVTATGEDELYTYEKYEGEHALLALNEQSCLLVVGEKKFRILGAGATKKWTKLPGQLYGEVHLFDHETLIYFSEIVTKEPEGHFEERRLTLNLYNFTTGDLRSALLEDFVTKGRVNLNIYRNQPSNVVPYNSVGGNVEISRGHDDWWIFGHRTNMTGKTDPAWLWNSVTNEWLRIVPQDFPREQPAIRYLASLGRYVADDSCQLDLLIDFDQLYSSRETFALEWGSLP